MVLIRTAVEEVGKLGDLPYGQEGLFVLQPAVQEVAELGVALLLFSIGLEFSFTRLQRMGTRAFLIGVLQICVTLGVFTLVFAGRGPFPQALALGAIIALSSTAIVLRVLMDRMEIDAIHGRNAPAILLTQDAAVVPLVLLVTIMGYGGGFRRIGIHIAQTLAAAGGLSVVFYLLFYIVIPKTLMSRGVFMNRELVVLLTIAIGAGSAWAAHAIGLSPALGTFIAGMLLAESPFATQIRSDIVSLRTLFVTLFFTSIGMLADPEWFLANWNQALLWLGIVFVLKGSPQTPEAGTKPGPDLCARAFIIGFGPAGQRVADQLLENGINAVLLKLNPRTAAIALRRDLVVHMVDATKSDSIAHVGIQGSCLVIVTVPDPRSAEKIIPNLRLYSPESMIIARSRFHIARQTLRGAGGQPGGG